MTTLSLACQERVTLKQGAGGRAMRALIEEVFLEGSAGAARQAGSAPTAMDDGAALWLGDRWLVVTTDSHVVHPALLPGRRHRPPLDLGHRQRPRHDGRDRSRSA